MFGTNRVMKPRQAEGDLLVREIFPTIQGEGPYTGRPAVFVRLAGCNLRCRFCDTDFDLDKARSTEPWEVASLAKQKAEQTWGYGKPWILVVTGGEPLLQNVAPLVEAMDREVQFETAGTVPPPPDLLAAGNGVTFVVSPKTPALSPLFHEYGALMHFKYIIADDDPVDPDGIPTCQAIQPGKECMTVARPPARATVWLQPREDYHPDGTPDPEATARNERYAGAVAVAHGLRLSIQTHKHAGLS